MINKKNNLLDEENNLCTFVCEGHLENAEQLLQSQPQAGQSEFTKVLLFGD